MLKLQKSLEIWAVSISDHNNGIWYAWCRYILLSNSIFASVSRDSGKISLFQRIPKYLLLMSRSVCSFSWIVIHINYFVWTFNIFYLRSLQRDVSLISCGFWVADGNRNFSIGGSSLESHMIRNCEVWIQCHHMMCNSMHKIADHNISWLTVHLSVW